MSANIAPNVVSDSLILYLDLANPKSYPQTGNTCSNLCDNTNSTLINGVAFSFEKSGCLVFDGIDDYVKCGPLDIDYTLSWTANVWFNLSTINKNNTIFGFGDGDNPPFYYWMILVNTDNYLQFWAYDGTNRSISDTNVLNINTWYNASVVYVSGSCSLYLNGANIATGSVITKNRTDFFNFTHLGYYTWNSPGVGSPLTGKESLVQIYTRALSDNEILTNYNTIKARFMN